jgi:excisionase family DNA binding protein
MMVERPRISGVYAIRHKPSRTNYLGSSRDVILRWHGHVGKLAKQAHSNPELQQAWNKDGVTAFDLRLLEPILPTNQLLLDAERKWWRWFVFLGLPLFSDTFPIRGEHKPQAVIEWSDPLLTVREIARMLQVSEMTIRRWIKSGRIRQASRITIRSGWRIRQSEVDRLLREST